METDPSVEPFGLQTGDRNDKTRRHNLSAVLLHLHHNGAVSRAELTKRTGLNRSTVGALVAELEEHDLVYETLGTARTGVGRPSPLVHPNSNVAVLAVNPDLDAVVLGLVGLGGVVHHKIRHHLKSPPSAEEVIKVICQLLRKMRPVIEQYSVLALGLAVPGLIRASDGVVQLAPHLRWRNEPLAERLADATGYPTFVGNDARLGMLAETVFGAGKGARDLVYLNGSTSGIGAGVLVGGRALVGADGYGGELGHTLIRSTGHHCYCGRRGCLETEVNLSHLTLLLKRQSISEEELDEALFDTNDRKLKAEVRRQIDLLSLALAGFISIFNPEAVILGGFLGSLYESMPERVHSKVAEHSLPAVAQRVRVERAKLGSQLPIVGAAELAFGRLFKDPLSTAAQLG